MTTEIKDYQKSSIQFDTQSSCIPSLGESHSHKINQRIQLYRHPDQNDIFIAKIVKCLKKPKSRIEFRVRI